MRWLAKAALQKALASCPGGERLNYFFQHRITKNYPRAERDFFHWISIAVRHCDLFLEHGSIDNLSEAIFYEFGTGWDLLIPFTWYALGVDHQILVDLNPHLRVELIADILQRFSACQDKLEARLNRTLRDLGGRPIQSVTELQERFGITYLAPFDARNTGLEASSVDFISSTATLEHIPPPDIYDVLVECRRILKADGIMSHRVDMVDHTAYFDPHISEYNFLKFSDETWSLLTSSLSYTNRLRYPDYLRLMKAAGFEVLAEGVEQPTAADLETLRRLKLAPRYRGGYSLHELGAKRFQIALRKKTTGNESKTRPVWK
jgi:SAM-dependent methyltransferase